MELHHLVAAVDESDAGREAVYAAVDLARRASARVTLLRIVPPNGVPAPVGPPRGEPGCGPGLEAERLWRWVGADLPPLDDRPPLDVVVTRGIPGIEICRFAEDSGASLLILGRKRRTRMARMLLGDTADAVARRSRIPCLFVPPGARPVVRVLAALDGTHRGLQVLDSAGRFATEIGAELRTVTEEQAASGEPEALARGLPRGRTVKLAAETGRAGTRLEIRRGAVVPEILTAVEDVEADALVIGYHRGGPAGVIEAGSIARRLAHEARCAVLTIPF